MTALRLSWTDVRDVIQRRILNRSYALGDKLPRDEDIAAELGCTRTTVQRAMMDLAAAGLIERRRKGGTTVRADRATRATFDIPQTRREVQDSGARYGYRLLMREAAPCPADIAQRLGHGDTARPMLHLRALHLADDAPFMLEDRWVDLTTCPEIQPADLHQTSANEWLLHHKPYSHVSVRCRAINASAEVAALMHCGPGTALLTIARDTWLHGAPITSVTTIAAPDYQLAT